MTPNLARLGDEGLRLLTATSDATWTHPSHYALMTGSLKRFDRRTIASDPDVSLATVLSRHGYGAVAITDGGYLSPSLGHHRGFDHFRGPPDVEHIYKLDEQIALAEEWIDRMSDAPLFLFLHTYAVHRASPAERKWRYSHGTLELFRPDSDATDKLNDWYDMLVRHTDRVLGAFLDSLREIATRRPVLLVILSDHGQALTEHGVFGHGPGVPLHDELTRIPIIVWSPRNVASASTLAEPVMLVDIAPSILGATGILAPEKMLGANRWPSFTGTQERTIAEVPGSTSHSPAAWSLRTPERKLIVTASGEGELGFELYDLREDTDELSNIASQHPGVVETMHEELMARLAALGMSKKAQGHLRPENRANPYDGDTLDYPSTEEMEEATQEQLRVLGYIE